jgi:transposase
MASRETWASRVERWRASGDTAREFARRAGLKASTLLWWSSQLGRESTSSKLAPVTFVELPRTARAVEAIEIVLETGVQVRVPVGVDAATLRCVLGALQERR